MGKVAERVAHDLLRRRWVHFLATDAHNTTTRPPRLSEARARVAKKYGAEYARQLCVDNPLAAFQGEALPEQMEPLDVYDNLKPKSWWQRLTSS